MVFYSLLQERTRCSAGGKGVGCILHPETGSWFGLGFPPRLTNPFLPPESVNFYQTCLGRIRHWLVHPLPSAGRCKDHWLALCLSFATGHLAHPPSLKKVLRKCKCNSTALLLLSNIYGICANAFKGKYKAHPRIHVASKDYLGLLHLRPTAAWKFRSTPGLGLPN